MSEDLTDEEIDRRIAAGLAEDTPEGGVTVLECPHCGKSDLSYVAGMETGHQYRCPHCDYEGAFAIETERSVDELRRRS